MCKTGRGTVRARAIEHVTSIHSSRRGTFGMCGDEGGCRLDMHTVQKMTAVGLEPTQLALVELESTPLDHSGKLSMPSEAGSISPRLGL